jgi:hypothetical protein
MKSDLGSPIYRRLLNIPETRVSGSQRRRRGAPPIRRGAPRLQLSELVTFSPSLQVLVRLDPNHFNLALYCLLRATQKDPAIFRNISINQLMTVDTISNSLPLGHVINYYMVQ